MANKMRWIPVTKALPDKPGEYLCTTNYLHDKVYIEIYYGADSAWSTWSNPYITAWMPLPEPYHLGTTETE